jgi:hypothetical protein
MNSYQMVLHRPVETARLFRNFEVNFRLAGYTSKWIRPHSLTLADLRGPISVRGVLGWTCPSWLSYTVKLSSTHHRLGA